MIYERGLISTNNYLETLRLFFSSHSSISNFDQTTILGLNLVGSGNLPSLIHRNRVALLMFKYPFEAGLVY